MPDKYWGIKTKNAVRCTICGSSADLMIQGYYQCQHNKGHCGDTFVGLFIDLTRGNYGKSLD